VVTGSEDHSIRVWDISSAKCVATILGHHGKEVCTVAVSLDGKRIISGCDDTTVRLWPISDYLADGEPASLDAARTSGGSVKAAEQDALAHASHADISIVTASSSTASTPAASIPAASIPAASTHAASTTIAAFSPVLEIDQVSNPLGQLDRMTWLPAHAPVRRDLVHADLWDIMSSLTTEEWQQIYGIETKVRVMRLQQFVSDAIAWSKRNGV
jgi:hypothetical protein